MLLLMRRILTKTYSVYKILCIVMATQRIQVILPIKLLREFKRSVPKGLRSRYIADTIREELAKSKYKMHLYKI